MFSHRSQMRRLRQGYETVSCYWTISLWQILTQRLGVVKAPDSSGREGARRPLRGKAVGSSSHQSFPTYVHKYRPKKKKKKRGIR